MNLPDRTSANDMTFGDQRRLTKSPQVILLSLSFISDWVGSLTDLCMTQEVIASVRRLLVAARSHNQDLDQTDALKSKIHTIRRRIIPQSPTGIEDDELDIRTFEEELWSMYGLTGEIVPDELLKECQRRLRQTQPGSRSEMDRQEELEALDLIHRLRKTHSHAFSQLYAPGKWTEARRVRPDVQMLSKGIRFWALIMIIPKLHSAVASMMQF